MRLVSWKWPSVLLIVTAQATLTASNCASIEVEDATDSNGCAYPACETDIDDDDATFQEIVDGWTCVHDERFCKGPNQRFIPASEVLEAGKICSCKDILNYPTNVGACLTNGVYSPIVRDTDCVDGEVVCPTQDVSFALINTQQFTACDLKCDAAMGHASSAVPNDTYKGYSFPKFDWTVASKSEFHTIQAHHYGIIDDTLYLGGTISSLDRCYKDGKVVPLYECTSIPYDTFPLNLRHLLKGPFNANDPTSENGSYVQDMIPIRGASDPRYKCTIAQLDKNSGRPRDLSILRGTGECFISSMNIGSNLINEKVIIAGGHHNAGGELSTDTKICTPKSAVLGDLHTKCESGQTIIKAIDTDGAFDTAFVFLMESNGDIRWLIQPWLGLITNGTGALNTSFSGTSVTGSSVNTYGNIYISGYRFEKKVGSLEYIGMISKHSRDDGSIVWEKEFPGVRRGGIQLVHDTLEDVLYVTLEIPEGGTIPSLGITCNSGVLGVGMCSVLARLSANDGALHWARYAYGSSGNKKVYPKPQLAHVDDGPYVYAAFSGAGSLGPINLDRGTSYSGCKDVDGYITPEVDPKFSNIKARLTSTICTNKGFETYFDRESGDAVPANVFNSRALCFGNSANHDCLVKYNKYTGRPIWGSVMPPIEAFQPLADGIIVTGTIEGKGTFDTVEIASPASLPGSLHSTVYQSKIDLNGKGLYVQPITSHQSNAHTAGLTHDLLTGDIYIGFMTDASKTYLGSGSPVGFTQDLALVDENPSLLLSQRITIAKLGVEEMPYCITSSSNGENEYDIVENECFIDQVCYKKNEIGMKLNLSCQTCAPSFVQNKWMPFMVGTNYCHIDGVCYEAGEHLATKSGLVSKCQVCTPDNSPATWSLEQGFEDSGLDLPNDCVILENYYDDDDYYYDDDDNNSSLESEQEPDFDEYDDDEDYDDDFMNMWQVIATSNDDAIFDDLILQYLDDDNFFNTSSEMDIDDFWFEDDTYDDDDDDYEDDEEEGTFSKYAPLFIILIVLGSVFLLSVIGYVIYSCRERERNDPPEFFPTEGCELIT